MIDYAIIEAGGKQLWVEPGKFYDLNYIPGNPGDLIYLNRVLLLYKDNNFKIGSPCLESSLVKTKILKHIKGRKLIVFKMKPKKNDRCKKGHRQKLTRIFVEQIV
uniref:Large ribosomal subunit protein bL21c n=1 Tax=Dipterocladia arabiensis TaxID=2007176 RepID=A0A1Z1M044_9FLOR|nr:ribosomal protein L21 [Dipterocladia arabiensis]ARW59306.1 ribosomal protein L21 [Dipterocladia arabiensis]